MPRQTADTDPDLFVTVRMPREVAKRLDDECERRMVSRAYVVRRAVEDWLSQHEGKS